MQISPKSNISFCAIELSNVEKEKSTSIMEQLKNSKRNSAKLKLQLMDVFDKQIQKEARIKAGGLYYVADILQEMYLSFFETINNVKDLTTEKLVEVLNNFKPAKRDLKEEYRYGIESLSNNVKPNIEKPLENFITEKNVFTYLKKRSPEEREEIFKEIKAITSKSNLKPREKNALHKRARGKIYRKIAEENNVSKMSVMRYMRSGIAKVQDSQNVLPQEYDEFVEKLIKTYKFTENKEKIRKIVISHPCLLDNKFDKLKANVEKTSKLLGIDAKKFAKSALSQPQLFYQKPETMANNIYRAAELTGIDVKKYTKAAIKQPTLFYRKPEAIVENIENIAKVLKISKSDSIRIAAKTPQIHSLSFDKISENIVKTSKVLGMDEKTFIQAAKKAPKLLILKSETIAENIRQISKLLKLSPEDCNQILSKAPQIVSYKPQTLAANVNKTLKLLGVDINTYKAALLKYPSTLSYTPETVCKKVKIVQYYKQIKGENMEQLWLPTYSDANIYERMLKFLIEKSDNKKKPINKAKFVKYLLAQDKIYNLKIPSNEFVEEFIEFAKAFSENNLGKQIFKFKII